MTPLSELNTVDEARFLELTGGALEGEVWLAERVLRHRPFADVEAIIEAFETEINGASQLEKIQLIASHPDLGVKVNANLSNASVQEQASAGLDQLTEAEYTEFTALNTHYKQTFGFPFVICAREHNKHSILTMFKTRLENPRDTEIHIGTGEIIKIIRLRLFDLVNPSE